MKKNLLVIAVLCFSVACAQPEENKVNQQPKRPLSDVYLQRPIPCSPPKRMCPGLAAGQYLFAQAKKVQG